MWKKKITQTNRDSVIRGASCWNGQLIQRLVWNRNWTVELLPEGSHVGQETAEEKQCKRLCVCVLHKPLTGESRILTDTHRVIILKHILQKQVHGYSVKVLKCFLSEFFNQLGPLDQRKCPRQNTLRLIWFPAQALRQGGCHTVQPKGAPEHYVILPQLWDEISSFSLSKQAFPLSSDSHCRDIVPHWEKASSL